MATADGGRPEISATAGLRHIPRCARQITVNEIFQTGSIASSRTALCLDTTVEASGQEDQYRNRGHRFPHMACLSCKDEARFIIRAICGFGRHLCQE